MKTMTTQNRLFPMHFGCSLHTKNLIDSNSFFDFLLKNSQYQRLVLLFYDLKKKNKQTSNSISFQIILSNKTCNTVLILLAIWVQECLYLIEGLEEWQ
jgi:hypothetical protein